MMIDTPGTIALVVLLITVFVVCMLTFAALKQDPMKDHCFQARRMFFAAALLTGLGAVFMEGIIFYFYSAGPEQTQRGKEIFDACKTIVPPLVALVIGYYFGRNEESNNNGNNNCNSKN